VSRLRVWLGALLVTAASLVGLVTTAGAATSTASSVRHVFVIVLENESAATTFGPTSPAPYLSQTLRADGAYLPNYYGVGHNSNDNYIAMISGQAPSVDSQDDCQNFTDIAPGTIGTDGQAQGIGCVYPSSVQTIASQLTAQGFTWRDYNEDMGADPTRETAVCGHPAVGSADGTQTAEAKDMYATRHNPFVYFHSIIDDTAGCDAHVVNLNALPQDLASAAATPNYSFITPDLCDDGHDAPCADGEPGGLASADKFLQTWVPQITSSPAFQQNGLLLITFDEAATSDASACCGEIAGPNSPEPGITGPGGGDVGAVLVSPFITPGTVSTTPYNHYSMLGSIEDIFGLAHLGYAALPGETDFGADIFNRSGSVPGGGLGPGSPGPPPIPPTARISVPSLASTGSARPLLTLRWGGAPHGNYKVQVRDLSARPSSFKTLVQATTQTARIFLGTPGHTYAFRITPTVGGLSGAAVTGTTVVPSGTHPAKGRYSRHWRAVFQRGAWLSGAIRSSTPGSTFTLRYVGSTLSLIGEKTARGGVLRVTLDGRRHTLHLHASKLQRRRTLATYTVKPGVHHLALRVMRGLVALEGYGIASRTG
jgi:hypothetical protein